MLRSTILQVFLVCICLLGLQLGHAQLGFCPGDKGAPIFEEDFGTGTTNGPALPLGFTTYTFVGAGPQDGQYTISSDMGQLGSWHNTGDHTEDDIDGKAFIVNASFTADQFFNRTITGLCSDTFYEFSAWLLNVYDFDAGVCANGGIPINVRFEIWDSTDTNLLAAGDTGNIGSTSSPNWERYGLVFQTATGQSSVILKMLNNGDGGCGNDLAIDDIVFAACGDLTSITSDISGGVDFVTCESNAPVNATLTATPDFSVYSTHSFQWQESPDGNTWTDIPGATNNIYTPPPINTTTYYRVNVAENPSNLGSPFCSFLSEPYLFDIVPIPASPVSAGDVTICEDEAIPALQVTVENNRRVAWYDAPVGGNLLEPNSNNYTPTQAGIYYAEAYVNGLNCINPVRTAVTLTINSIPVLPSTFEALTLCSNEVATLDAGLAGLQYQWNTNEMTQTITIDTPGTYTVTVTNGAGCNAVKTFVVTGLTSPILSEPPFSDGPSVVIQTTNQGSFEYSLDGTNFQTSPVFPFVEGGIYTAFVRDTFGCGIDTVQFHHLEIPKYVTPNGDGRNDTFEVKGLSFFSSSTYYIFDRFGKLLKSGNGTTLSWDGTFNGQTLPASDYWYVINIEDQTFKGHFAIKR